MLLLFFTARLRYRLLFNKKKPGNVSVGKDGFEVKKIRLNDNNAVAAVKVWNRFLIYSGNQKFPVQLNQFFIWSALVKASGPSTIALKASS